MKIMEMIENWSINECFIDNLIVCYIVVEKVSDMFNKENWMKIITTPYDLIFLFRE